MKKVSLKAVCIAIIAVLLLGVSITGCGKNATTTTQKSEILTVFHAGSLTKPIREAETEFNKENGGKIVFKDESAGSVRVVKSISELHKLVDVAATADYKLIPQYLIPSYADWVVQFATNKLVIVYTGKSKYADEINTNNWYKILQRKDVEFGFSNPNADPCGYRTRLMFMLAEKYYNVPNLANAILKAVNPNNIKPKAVELVAGIQSGELDYAFEYLSVAVQNNLKYVLLPDQLNFGNPEYANFYKQASFTMEGGKKVYGAPIIYGITVPKNAQNKQLAEKFVGFLLGKKGKEIFEENGQPFLPLKANIPVDKLPTPVRNAFKQ